MRLFTRLVCAACVLFPVVSANAQNRFVYMNNQAQPNTITAYQINANGSLSLLPSSPILTGGTGASNPIESMAIVSTMAGPILYATNGGDPSISALTINAATGNLTPIAGSPFQLSDSAGGTYNIAASPNRRFVFVTNEASNVIHVLGVDPSTGALAEVAGSPFPAGANISGLWVTANSKFLLASGNSNNTVEVFSIASSGAIAQVPGSPFPANSSVSDVRSNCASSFVYTADNGSPYIDGYSMDADGSLTRVPRSPFYNGATGTGPNSFDLALSPNGKYVFTSDSFSTLITTFGIRPNGSLLQVHGSPVATNQWLGGTAITAAGDFLYTVDFVDAAVVASVVNSDGHLTMVPGSPFGGGQVSGGGEPNSVITYPAPACATPQ